MIFRNFIFKEIVSRMSDKILNAQLCALTVVGLDSSVPPPRHQVWPCGRIWCMTDTPQF